MPSRYSGKEPLRTLGLRLLGELPEGTPVMVGATECRYLRQENGDYFFLTRTVGGAVEDSDPVERRVPEKIIKSFKTPVMPGRRLTLILDVAKVRQMREEDARREKGERTKGVYSTEFDSTTRKRYRRMLGIGGSS